MKKNKNNSNEQDEKLYSWISSFSSNKKTTVIELIGLPGSGKSTLANTIYLWHIKSVVVFSDAKCLKDKEGGLSNKIVSSLLRVYRRILISTHRLELLIQNNKTFICYKKLINSSPVPRKVKQARLRMWLSGSRFYSKKNNTSLKKILIHDEGLIYRAMSLSQSDVNFIDIDKYLDLLPKPDALIYIHSSKDVIKKRLNKREYKTVNHVKLMHKSEIAFKRIRSKYDVIESFDYYSDLG
jgi:thymidylate kinase